MSGGVVGIVSVDVVGSVDREDVVMGSVNFEEMVLVMLDGC